MPDFAKIMQHSVLTLLTLSLILVSCAEKIDSNNSDISDTSSQSEIKRITYQNPGITVDLGVGLWAWPLPMDYDEDGDLDLVVATPDTPFNGTYFFENTSAKNTKMPLFKAPKKVGAGKQHLQVSYIEGDPRIIGRGTEYQNFKKNTFEEPTEVFPKDSLENKHENLRFSQWKYVDYEGDGDLDVIVGIDEWGEYGWDNAFDEDGNWTNGPLHGYVYLLENQDGSYVDRGKIEANGNPIDVYGASTPNMKDFDGDGDLDLICGEFLDRFTWFENVGSREEPRFAEGRFLKNDQGVLKMNLEMIIPTSLDWDRDGDIDLIVGDEDGRVAFVENTGEVHNDMPLFKSPKYFQQEPNFVKFGALATPYSVDWDNDGDEDLIVGNTAGYIGFIENLDGGDPPQWAAPKRLKAQGEVIRIMAGENGSIQGPAEAKWGYTTLSVADWDHDGLQDIIVNSIWGKVVWYKNIGTKSEPQLASAQPVQISWEGNIHKPEWNWWDPEKNNFVTQWRTTPFAIDWNEDGLTDIVMLDQEGYLAFFERFEDDQGSYMLKPGQRIFYSENNSAFDNGHSVTDSTSGALRLNSEKFGSSGRRKITFTDWDQDGDLDLLINSKNVSLLENIETKDGRVYFTNRGVLNEHRLAGHTTSPTTVDWNDDGIPDLLVGAEDGHFYYMENTED